MCVGSVGRAGKAGFYLVMWRGLRFLNEVDRQKFIERPLVII